MEHWLRDKDLASARDREALAKLPPEERQAWQALWAEVDKTLQAAKPAVSEKTKTKESIGR
jgi:hypothetical protein